MSVGRFLQQAAGGAGGDTGDGDFANVTLLLDGDGTSGDANNTFTDSSTNGFTVTESGSVVQGSFSPYGDNWSNYFNNNPYLTVPQDAAFNFGTGDFTVEFWVNVDTHRTSGSFYDAILTFGFYTSSPYFRIHHDGRLACGLVSAEYYSTSTVNIGKWDHYAISRSGTTLRIFVNGTLETTATHSASLGNSAAVTIGTSSWQAANEEMNGYISNLRIVKGTALYTSSFTPDDSPLTNVTNTSLLTCQSNRFIDNSSNGFTVSIVGSPKVTPFSPFKDSNARTLTADGGSGYFDLDSTAYLRFSGGPPIVSDMTISGWVHPKTMAPQAGSAYPRVFAAGNFLIYVRDDDIRIYNGGEKVQAPINNNEWTYFAAQRNSNTWTLYINGVSKGTASDSSNIALNPTNYIGSNGASNYFTGYIADLRITTSGSTSTAVPTSPVSAVTDTQLLLNFQDAGIYDRSGINNLDTVGNAQIDTAVKKYGTGSMQFDGTGDGLSSPETTSFGFGSGDFTIEAWAYLTTNGVFNNIVSAGIDASNGYRLDISTSNNLRFLANLGSWITVITGSTSLATGQWYHLAVTRNGNNFNLWVDGSSDATTVSNSGTIADPTTKIEVGAVTTNSLNRSFNGYLDDVRVTKGIARYTADFTAPDAALPKF